MPVNDFFAHPHGAFKEILINPHAPHAWHHHVILRAIAHHVILRAIARRIFKEQKLEDSSLRSE